MKCKWSKDVSFSQHPAMTYERHALPSDFILEEYMAFRFAESKNDYQHEQTSCHTGQAVCSVLSHLVRRKAPILGL